MPSGIKRMCVILLLTTLSFCRFALAAQTQTGNLGLKTVVLDPGHGGKDPGAIGKNRNMHEKHIVHAVSKLLGQKIKDHYPDVKVIYTRTGDTFLGLHERAMVARRNNADLFISIHCNGVESSAAKGSSVYILGQRSERKDNKTDYFERNMSTAQRENAVMVLEDDYKTKYQSFDPDSPESYISHQLQWMAYYESSLLFASEVVNHLISAPLTPRRQVVEQDIFQVLVEANMPAVLIELAFVTNPVEYKYLSSVSGQEEIAERLFKAFKSYKSKFDASVDVQPAVSASVPEISGYYAIQVMGLGKKLAADDAAFKGLECTGVKSETSGIYKYVFGRYQSAKDASGCLPEVLRKFPEAFVVYVEGDDVKRVK